jgi:hypothetical protein
MKPDSPRTGFPHYRGVWIFRSKAGWEDLGEIERKYVRSEGWSTIYSYMVHPYCNTTARVGRDHDGSLFKFCPRCLVNLND